MDGENEAKAKAKEKMQTRELPLPVIPAEKPESGNQGGSGAM